MFLEPACHCEYDVGLAPQKLKLTHLEAMNEAQHNGLPHLLCPRLCSGIVGMGMSLEGLTLSDANNVRDVVLDMNDISDTGT